MELIKNFKNLGWFIVLGSSAVYSFPNSVSKNMIFYFLLLSLGTHHQRAAARPFKVTTPFRLLLLSEVGEPCVCCHVTIAA